MATTTKKTTVKKSKATADKPKSIADLQQDLLAKQNDLLIAKQSNKSGELVNTSVISTARKDIARLNTQLTQAKRAEQKETK